MRFGFAEIYGRGGRSLVVKLDNVTDEGKKIHANTGGYKCVWISIMCFMILGRCLSMESPID